MKTERSKNILTSIVAVLIACLSLLIYQSSKATVTYEHTIKQLLDNTFSTIIICDKHQNIIFASPNSVDSTGYTQKELIDGGLQLIMPSKETYSKHTHQFDEFVKSNNSSNVKIRNSMTKLKTKDQKIQDAAIRIVFINDMFYAFILTDETLNSIRNLPQITDNY